MKNTVEIVAVPAKTFVLMILIIMKINIAVMDILILFSFKENKKFFCLLLFVSNINLNKIITCLFGI